MSTRDEIDALAGEYVLGTLDAAERADVARRRGTNRELDAAIRDWERRLGPLDAECPEQAPPAGLFASIEKRLFPDEVSSQAGGGSLIVMLEARARRWRNRAIAASALAACLTLAIALRETVFSPRSQSYVAVFHRDDELPSFMMTIDLSTREVTVRPVGATRQPGKTYQLWIASEQLGPRPRSLGLIGDGSAPGQALLTAYEPALLSKATFGVSLEPAGGSPTGQPTSPALHAKLYPARP